MTTTTRSHRPSGEAAASDHLRAVTKSAAQGMAATQVTRRELLAGAAGAAGLVALAGPSVARGAVRQDAAVPSGQIIYATRMSELTTLHPFLARFTSALAVAYHINEGLVKFAPTFELVPGLATEWTISEDQLTFTFTLRPGVTWHDGTPFTAADVRFTIETAAAEDSQAAAQNTVRTYISAVETPDDATVILRLTQPYSPLLTVLAEQLTILPSHLLSADPYSPAFAERPVGTGPYRVVDRQASFVTLEANPSYWGEPARVGTIILRDSPEAAAQQAGLLGGELDVIQFNPTTMASLEAQGYVVARGLAGSVHGINVDLETPLLQDANVRKALQLALDRERIQSILYANGVMANTVVSPAYGDYHDDSLPAVSRDLDGARAALDAAGWVAGGDDIRVKDGQPLRLQYQAWAAQNWQDIAAIAQASWREVGIDLEIVTVELANLTDTMSGQFQLATVGWPLTSDVIVGLTQLFRSTELTLAEGGTRNVFGYKSEAVDGLLDQAYATTDVTTRADLARQIQAQVYADLPLIPFAHPAYQLVSRPGITLDETGAGALSSVGPGFFMNRWQVTES
ncbi:MAG TPA: ABC transporter substrate-binding protein [Thermomicrobiales bacterium]|nr:ABC transporter substrate-binding protein [Thermomicrobiales bacterium]